MLWVSEGITSYYQGILLQRAGIYTLEEYLNVAAENITVIENIPGNKIQSAAESSFDAWIKNYRPNENSNNATISYYSRGAVIGNLLDLEIIAATKGQKSLDNVFRYLWAEYYQKRKRGYTDAEFQKAVELTAGRSLDAFFRNNIYGTQTFDYTKFFGYAGLKLVDTNAGKSKTFLGATTAATNGKLLVTAVHRDSPAWKNGINVNDELISVNDNRVGTDLNSLLALFQPQDQVKITVNRAGKLLDLDITLGQDPTVKFALEKLSNPAPEQQAVYQKWLRTK
jgi:predicted metalloprotease with PDZ domain